MRLALLIPLMLAAGPSPGESPMSAEAFDAYTRGKTLFYGFEGQAYGAERYLDGRRVIWSFLDGDCKHGRWYEQGGQICFVYEDRPDPQCWTFLQRPGGLVARFRNDPQATELYEAGTGAQDMICHGPKVGV